MSTVKIYGNQSCPYCGAARMLLTQKGIAFDDINITSSAEGLAELRLLTTATSVPQIFVGSTHVGGFDELHALDKSGELDNLLAPL